MEKKGKLFVISAPSGAGKTTLIRQVLERFPHLAYSISHTTRKPRAGEIHGKDYFFIEEKDFVSMIDQDQWIEWAQVHGNYYGTSKGFVRERLGAGNSLLLDIDVQGAGQIMAAGLNPVSIFIQPPSLEALAQRLERRGTDAPDVIARRMENAKSEIAQQSDYDHVVVNDDLNQAIEVLCMIFEHEMGAV